MLDTARSYFTIEKIKELIRAMQIAKFSVLHLHLTDGDSFTIEIKKYPNLNSKDHYS